MCADPRVRGMASSSRKRFRLMIDVNFGSLEDKGAFVRRLQSVRERLTPAGSAPIDNSGLMCAVRSTWWSSWHRNPQLLAQWSLLWLHSCVPVVSSTADCGCRILNQVSLL